MNKTILPPFDHVQSRATALRLRDRYLSAETTPAEEAWLLGFVLSPRGSGAEWDNLRAVLTFTAMGRRQSVAAPRPAVRRHRPMGRVAAVMAVALLGAAAWWTVSRPIDEPSDICVAYVDGKKITDQAQVLSLMHESMREMGAVGTEELLRDDLSDMLRAPAE